MDPQKKSMNVVQAKLNHTKGVSGVLAKVLENFDIALTQVPCIYRAKILVWDGPWGN